MKGTLRLRPLVSLIALLALSACGSKEPAREKEAQPSPNASILPAPLASAGDLVDKDTAPAHSGRVGIPADSAGRLILQEPAPEPTKPAAANEPLPRDSLGPKETAGVSLKGEWLWSDLPPKPPVPELSPEGLKAALAETAFRVNVDLAFTGRMRLELDSASFPLPAHTEFRARSDYFGFALVWPNGTAYRVLSPGSVRAIFAERRADVTPVMPSRGKSVGRGAILGYPTERTQLTTNVGSAIIDQAKFEGSGPAGMLLCRFLLELIAVQPSTEACRPDRVPLGIRYEWAGGGSLGFKVTSVEHRAELPLSLLVTPPPAAEFMPGDLPPQASGVFLTREQLARFRTRAVPRTEPPPRGAPGEGITADNHTDVLRYLLIDGVPVAWVRPRASRYIIGPQSGRYALAWRDFFGMSTQPPVLVDLPARVELGVPPDAGTAKP